MSQKKTGDRHHPFQWVMGKNCIRELLHHAPSRILKILTSRPQNDPLVKEIVNENISISFTNSKKLSHLVKSESHQSFIAKVSERPRVELNDFIKNSKLILMLDSISDPQNLGALLRAAECFGVDGVIWSKNRGGVITPAVSKVSVGASEIVPTLMVSNLVEAIKKFQKEDFWVVVADIDGESLYTFDFPEKMVLVVGSEGEGVRPLVMKNADYRVSIPMKGKIDSLNVSQATSVILSIFHKIR